MRPESAREAPSGKAAPGSSWLIGPQADLLFIANLTWPLLAALLWLNNRFLHTGIELYLTAVVGTPHRWITLGLVANDRERLSNKGPTLALVGASTLAFFLGLWWWTRDLALLVLVRYLWNIWHVAAQHTGIARIYDISSRPEKRFTAQSEKHLVRLFMLYCFLRVGSLGGAFQGRQWLLSWVQRFSLSGGLDGLALLVPLWLLAREYRSYDVRARGKYVYLASICSNYVAMLAFAHYRMPAWAFAAATANAMIHATEYFSILTWSIERRAQRAESWFLPVLAQHWTKTLLAFLYFIAIGSLALATQYTFVWVMANTLVSYLHYAYDAVIWKMPEIFRPKPPLRLSPQPT